MPETLRRWTRAEVLALPEDRNRYELVDGELLVSPSPRWIHQHAVSALNERVRVFVREHRLGVTMFSPADLELGTGQLLQPDLFVVPLRADGREPREWRECGVPLLVVEVTSPSTARYDRVVKRRHYQRSGVAEYWIVDVDARVVERWRPSSEAPEVVRAVLEWQPEGAKESLTIDVEGYFREVWGEV